MRELARAKGFAVIPEDPTAAQNSVFPVHPAIEWLGARNFRVLTSANGSTSSLSANRLATVLRSSLQLVVLGDGRFYRWA